MSHDGSGGMRWLLTYADLITLLLVFFIICYASANQETIQAAAVADAISGAFTKETKHLIIPGQGMGPGPLEMRPNAQKRGSPTTLLVERLRDAVSVINSEVLIVRFHDRQIAIDFPSETFFLEDGVTPDPAAETFLGVVADILNNHSEKLTIASYRQTPVTGSLGAADAWELTATQSSSLVRSLVGKGAEPSRLSAIALAQNTRRIGLPETEPANGVTFLFLQPEDE